MRCAECFDNHLRAELLSEICEVCAFYEHTPVERIRLQFTCQHGRDHTHLSYRGSADWGFALRLFRADSVAADIINDILRKMPRETVSLKELEKLQTVVRPGRNILKLLQASGSSIHSAA